MKFIRSYRWVSRWTHCLQIWKPYSDTNSVCTFISLIYHSRLPVSLFHSSWQHQTHFLHFIIFLLTSSLSRAVIILIFHGKLLLFNAHIICIAHDDAEYFIPNEIRVRKIINAWCHFSDAITRQIYKINRFLININHMLMTSDNLLSVRRSTTASNYNLLSY